MSADLKVLAVLGDEEGPTWLRLQVGSDQIKHVTVDYGVFDSVFLCCKDFVPSMLPAPPGGDRRTARVTRNMGNAEAGYVDLDTMNLPSIQDVWHVKQIDISDIKFDKPIRLMETYLASWPEHDKPVIAKICDFSYNIESFEQETTAYRMLQPHSIGPKFLGHIVEHGRVVRFLLEKLEGHHAEIEDLSICQAEVRRLHQAGFLHGDINKHNLIVHDGTATLIDFSTLRQCDDVDELDAEYAKIEPALLDRSGRGGWIRGSQHAY